MADYAVKFSSVARDDLRDIFFGNEDRYTIADRIAYLDGLEAACSSLEVWPARYVSVTVSGRTYRKLIFKAHVIYYRIYDKDALVVIDTILHSHMDPSKWLP